MRCGGKLVVDDRSHVVPIRASVETVCKFVTGTTHLSLQSHHEYLSLHRHCAHSFLDTRSAQAATIRPTIMSVPETTFYIPGLFLSEADLPDDYIPPPDLLILNQPIASFDVFSRLWSHTNYHVCADGGANRLYDMFNGALEEQRENYVHAQLFNTSYVN